MTTTLADVGGEFYVLGTSLIGCAAHEQVMPCIGCCFYLTSHESI